MSRLAHVSFCAVLLGTLALSAVAQSLAITTLAGSTAGGGYRDDVGAAARFSLPHGIAVRADGAVFVADRGNHVIRRIDPDGRVTTVAGLATEAGTADGPASEARFNFPTGVVLGADGSIFVADTNNHSIRKISTAGVVTTLAGISGHAGIADGTGSEARFAYPRGIGIDRIGNLFVADTGNHALRKIDLLGSVTTLAGSKMASGASDGFGSQARFNRPFDVAVDAAGIVYVADTGNHTVRKVTPEGRVTTLAGGAGTPGYADALGVEARFDSPSSIEVDVAGNVFVSDTPNHTIRKIAPSALVVTVGGAAGKPGNVNGPGPSSRFDAPGGIALGPAGDLFVADQNNHAIRKITPTFNVAHVAGSTPATGITNGEGTAARFNAPRDVAIDAAGAVYVADSENHAIRKISPSGAVTTFAGYVGIRGSRDGNPIDARFSSPGGVAVDRNGNVYVADTANHTIRKVTPAGVVTTLAGLAGQAGDTDGSGPQARFNRPAGIAADALGNVYVADTLNHRIRMVEPAGVVTTFAGSGAPGSGDGVGSAASFNLPTDVATDDQRNIYVADRGNGVIRKITQFGEVTTIAGKVGETGTADALRASDARFDGLTGITARGDGTLFVADTANHTIRRIAADGAVTTLAGVAQIAGNVDGAGRAARLFLPTGLEIDEKNRIVIADASNHAIRLGAPALPTIAFFTATPSSIRAGETATLNWEVRDADSITLDNGTVRRSVTVAGPFEVAPQTSTTYTLTATGDGGTASASITVHIAAPRARPVARR